MLNILFYGCPISDDIAIVENQIEVFESHTLKSFLKFEKIKDYELFFLCIGSELLVRDRVRTVLESGIELKTLLGNEDYAIFLKSKVLVIDEFLTRSFDDAYRKAQKFKSQNGRNNYMRRYFKKLYAYKEKMCPENFQRLKALEMMIELNGVEPAALQPKRQKN